jgi:oxygen-independent coproporphyrinogen-3 oxidase
MLGLYVHIPFCAHRCPYCDFAVLAGRQGDFVATYVATLHAELESVLGKAQSNECAGRELTSIFFGGGTPTRLDGEVLASLLNTIRVNFPLAAGAEITIEANPEDATLAKLATLFAAGWNRISFGAQSFDASELKFLGRHHDASQIEMAVDTARAAGFENISLDCIYALPKQTLPQWQNTLERIVALNVPHVSCYSLTIEDGTAFKRRVTRGTLHPLADETQAVMMQTAGEFLGRSGLERYEISNYAKVGFRSMHNENYWRGGDYLACGNAAHGHLNGRRWWNERDPKRYVEVFGERGTAVVGDEVLTPRARLDEIAMLGLRRPEGFDLCEASQKLGFDVRQELNGALVDLTAAGVLEIENDRVRLSAESLPVADAVTSRLLT